MEVGTHNTLALYRAGTKAAFEHLWRNHFAPLAEKDRDRSPERKQTFTLPGFCVVCGRPTRFETDPFFASQDVKGRWIPCWRERQICACGMNCRMRSCYHLLTHYSGLSPQATLYCTEQVTPLFQQIKTQFPNAVGSEFYGSQIPLGNQSVEGIRNEDITQLTFETASLDGAFSLDVLEHVPDYGAGLDELARCIKPGGVLLLTVPFDFGRNGTVIRARVRPDGSVDHILPPEYHGDPINPEGVLCFNSFGWDLIERIRSAGFADAHIYFFSSSHYGYVGLQYAIIGSRDGTTETSLPVRPLARLNEHVQTIDEGADSSHDPRVPAPAARRLDFTGERYTPEIEGKIAYEHYHRYLFSQGFCQGKRVLDIACGEGYGTALLAADAKQVIGVDIDPASVAHAQTRYGSLANVEFRNGRCEAIPCEDQSLDLVVSFETLEHIEDHSRFLREARRVLKPDGRLIISTPNKGIYTDAAQHSNPFHVKELYPDEFETLLKESFPSVQLVNQRVTFSSLFWSTASQDNAPFFHYRKTEDDKLDSVTPPFSAEYLLAVCGPTPDTLTGGNSLFTAEADDLYEGYNLRGAVLNQKEEEVRSLRQQVSGSTAPAARQVDGEELAHTKLIVLKETIEELLANADFELAARMSKRALRLGPNRVDLCLLAAQAAFGARDRAAAHDHLQRAKELAPESAEVWLSSAALNIQEGKLSQAEQQLTHALELDGLNPDALRLLAMLLQNRRAFEEAANYYVQLAAIEPGSQEAKLGRAECYRELGRRVLAQILYEEILDQDPASTAAKDGLRLLDCPEDTARSVGISETDENEGSLQETVVGRV